MFLTVRLKAPFLAAAATVVSGSAVAAAPAPTKSECIAASESGQDLQHAGRFRKARAQFASCVPESCPGPIREDCAQRLDDIAKAMPSIVFEVTDSAGNVVRSVAITVDGQPLAVADNVVATAVELDPGEHTFSIEAPGLTKLEKRLVLAEGVKQRREAVIMVRAEAAQSIGETTTASAGPPTLAWVAFGFGGAGLTLGVISGLVAGGKHSTLEGECNNTAGTCTSADARDLDSFHTWRTISTVSYVVGALGVAGGAVLWFTTPKEPRKMAARVWLGPASAGISGRF
jgi:hypothetical protein